MNKLKKIMTARRAEYCTKCFAPEVFIKSNTTTHLHKHCEVTQTKKHKFSCLSKTCLKHSWICQDHVEENGPLLAAHHEELATLMRPKKNTEARDTPEEVGPTPTRARQPSKNEHPALFLFCSIPGRYRAANVLCDTGNPHCLFTTGTPKNLCGIRRDPGLWEPLRERS